MGQWVGSRATEQRQRFVTPFERCARTVRVNVSALLGLGSAR
jgi:hypothetical protein